LTIVKVLRVPVAIATNILRLRLAMACSDLLVCFDLIRTEPWMIVCVLVKPAARALKVAVKQFPQRSRGMKASYGCETGSVDGGHQ
jgi:hypothetical protein